MTDSRRLAGLVGPVLMILAITEAMNLRLLASELGPGVVHVVYLNGTLLFIGGLALVRAHNLWTRRWPVLITLTGWFTVLAGMMRMLAPGSAQMFVPGSAELPERYVTSTFVLLTVLLAVGIVLTYKGYFGAGKTAMRSPANEPTQ